MQEQISKEELRNQDFGHNMQQTPPPGLILTYLLSELSVGSPGLANLLSYMCFLSSLINKH